MTPIELLVVVVCLVVGYVLVNRVLYKGDDTPDKGRGRGPHEQPKPGQQREQDPPGGARPGPEKYEPFGPRWCAVLGVRPEATRDEISAAYKRKISQYHPDKATSLGPEIRELAEQRSKEINAAYDEAMRRFR